MAGHHKWSKLVDRMTPERRARVEKGVRKDLERMLLIELRKLSGLTQVELARSLGIKQPTLSRLESQDDMQISTLRRIIEALGGKMELIATLPTGRVSLCQFDRGRTPSLKRSA
jgi:DNA-binding XRE family transcriptional regulator